MLLPPPPEVPPRSRPARFRRLLVLSLCATLGGLFAARVAVAAHDPAGPYRKLDVFTHVLSLIENNYVEGVDETRLIYGAIEGMVRTLDPHSTFMDPKAYAALKQETDGEYGGVGLEVAAKSDELVVIAPIDDSPASRAGILPGDRLLEVDGVPTRGWKEQEGARALMGGTDHSIVAPMRITAARSSPAPGPRRWRRSPCRRRGSAAP